MLAQNFKTAADLGISETELEALVRVLGMLERDEVKHVEVKGDMQFYREDRTPTQDFLFNMDNVYCVADCKTAACIAGTSDLFCGTRFAPDGSLRGGLPEELNDLF